MINIGKTECLVSKLNNLARFKSELSDENLEEFNNFRKGILESLDDNQKLRFNRINFYNEVENTDVEDFPFFRIEIKIDNIGFNQAETLLSDTMFLLSFDRNSLEDLKLYKLLKARQGNLDFEIELAEFICGDDNSFPYRTSSQLTSFFTDLGFKYIHDGTTRRYWVKDVLLQLTIKEISIVIERGLFNKREFRKEAKEKRLNYEGNYQKAIEEFKAFFKESLNTNKGIDLSFLIDLNINTELLVNKDIDTDDEELNKLIEEAKKRFFNPMDKQVAIEKLWDAFERLKTYYQGIDKRQSAGKLLTIVSGNIDGEFINNEFIILTKIGNEYRIRHHETDKKEIHEIKHLNYLFFRMLSLIDLCLTSIKENKYKLP
ncbi:MAG: hypothetical protein M0R38_10625 [Bacteroidia bacterium]|nr:hypothetical protein [Bacteroidia bacterium]